MRRILIGFSLVFFAQPAWAQTQQQHDWCISPTATDDQTIEGCTALIQSSQQTQHNLAVYYDNRGVAYEDKGLYDQAIADENKSIALNPSYALGYLNRGDAYSDKELFDEAIADETKSIALEPDLAEAYFFRGFDYLHKSLYNQAIADETKSIALEPDNAFAYNTRGLAYEKKNQRDQAISDYRAALKIDPNMQAVRGGLKRLGVTP